MNKNVSAKKDIRKKMLEDVCRKILEREYEYLQKYFEDIINGGFDYVIFISRRCYILYQIFAFIGGWSYRCICTDLGIYARKDEIAQAKKIIVVDDIGFTGESLKRVIGRVKGYVRPNCTIKVLLYAKNKENIKLLETVDGIKIFDYCRLTEGQCQTLSRKLVSTILDCGMPYTTFVYPMWGQAAEIQAATMQKYSKCVSGTVLEEYKWETSYYYSDTNGWTNTISYFDCVREYKRKYGNESYMYFLPFLFVMDMNADKAINVFGTMADILGQLGKKGLEKEIRDSLLEKREKKDAMEYLACMFSCLCSRLLAECMELKKYIIMDEEDTLDSLKGSFSEEFVNLLETCDTEFAQKFLEKWEAGLKEDEEDEDIDVGRYIYYAELDDYISKNSAEKTAYEMMVSIFEWMKKSSINNGEARAIRTRDLVKLLRETGGYDRNDIYIAQIECWDRGVATYRFFYSEEAGLVSICSAGEMSSLVSLMKYQKLAWDFYFKKMDYDIIIRNELQEQIIEEVLKEAVAENEFTLQEINEFKKMLEERDGNIYKMLI